MPNGKIALDIRDSVPDWAPYLPPKAPDGAPNVLFLAWDDVGYGTMDVFGGPVETPNMRRIADMGVRFSNFHTTALCSPTRSSLLTGRNATSNGMATIAEFSSGFPGISTRIPFENGFISEVLAERGYNTYCVGKWHLTPGEECNLAAFKGRWPLGRGFERLLRVPRRRVEPVVSRSRPGQQPDRSAGYARGRVPPVEGSRRPGDRHDPGRQGDRSRQAVLHVPRRRGAGHAPHHVFKEWADKYKGKFDQGYEAIRAGILEQQKKLGLLPEDTELSPINPHGEPARTGPDGQPWPVLDTVRPWDSLSDDERRLFARMAEVFAGFISYTDDQTRSRARLPRSVGAARQHARRLGVGQRRQRRRRARTVRSTSGASSTVSPTRPRRRFRTSTISARRSRTTTTAPVGRGRSTRRSRTGSGGPATRVASPTCAWSRGRRRSSRRRTSATSTSTRSTSSRPCTSSSGIEPPAVIKGYTQSPIEGESFAAALTDPNGAGEGHAVLHDARSALDLPPGMARVHRAPADRRMGQVRTRRVGAVRPRARPLAVEERRGAGTGAARNAEEPVVLLRRDLQRIAARRSLGARADARRTPTRRGRTGSSTPTTRTSPTSPSPPAPRSTAGRTRSPPASTSTRSTRRVCSTRTVALPAATASTSRTRSCATRSTGSARSSTTSSPTPRSHPDGTYSPPTSPRRVGAPIRRCRASEGP